MHPATLFFGFWIHLAHGLPETQRSVGDSQLRGRHAPAFEIAEQCQPGFGRFAVAVLQCDDLLAAVGCHADDDQAGQSIVL